MGLFDRLFGQEKQEEQVALVEEVETEQSASSEDTVTTEVESATQEMEEFQSEVAEPELTAEQEAQKQRTLDMMAQYYAAKEAAAARVKEAQEQGFDPAIQTKVKAEPVEEVVPVEQESEQDKYQRTLKKTRTGFGARLNEFFANFRSVDEEFFEELEEMLILSDVGVQVASTLTQELRYEAKLQNAKKTDELRRVIIEKLVDIYEKDGQFSEQINFQEDLTVMLFVGVNGVGKTTSIGKLAYKYKQAGKKVMLVAADTFRAGAVAQLVEWGRRVDVPVVTGPEKSDPASVVFDGVQAALAEGVDILMIDTAGRLQNKDNLMAELEKIGRIIKRTLPDAPHETLLALDASTGQNALSQAKEFAKITPLTGLVLTKLDGTAKGGVVLAIRQELDIPVKLIGFGEKIDDIGEFKSEEFMRGLLEGLV
ncbi:TPA: signal recognition particle-docking protein FtsY [Streptococcus suis 2524]|uniref:signal recognition particle-docking protein FtsY n=1 Tax=Streptococcus suis TaxID=1307 RepID=UPI000404946C|nr:signal recognition particle-docking protein FtsY [Streptococcus suis]RRR33061.1 signal recognition particle-docking protein FtsY [Streptococcus suis]RRR39585.1 signal recognition particle-docking protein FtsY [Streptococcus suis]RRR60815.1 signal recognition particle-docking protein FtsY [Streptococcus suis]HEM3217224.1 signal recognition particle-docking protein FtsY [Streptococcus suis 2524]HEM4180546.1 signal recognition particle-docking protein FtsY [Streptococcus suis]